MTAEGAVDVVADAGQMRVDFSGLLAGAGGTPTPLDRPIDLEWTRTTLTARVKGEQRSIGRARARTDGGLLGRMPDEPGALVGLLRAARGVRELGEAEVAGSPGRRYAMTIRGPLGRRISAAAGIGSIGRDDAVPPPSLQVWIGEDGRPRRLAYVVDFPPFSGGGGVRLPRRTVTGTYELDAFGEAISR